MNVYQMIDASLNQYDYVVLAVDGAKVLRLHKLQRSGGYWLSSASGNHSRADTVEEAVAIFEARTREMVPGFQVVLEPSIQ
jgi:hypothetical protein